MNNAKCKMFPDFARVKVTGLKDENCLKSLASNKYKLATTNRAGRCTNIFIQRWRHHSLLSTF